MPAGDNSTAYDSSYTVDQLRAAAKGREIRGYGAMNKDKLLEVLDSGE